MNPKQKDTIREELDSEISDMNFLLFDREIGITYLNVKLLRNFVMDKMQEAYQSGFKSGAKDKVEEVREQIGGVGLQVHRPETIKEDVVRFYKDAVEETKRIITNLPSLKDNT